MTRDLQRLALADFERLLEVYGSNPDRWPADCRAAALACAAENVAAARALAEARALDAVLARAPGPDPSRLQPLTERIFAAAVAGTGAPASLGEQASLKRQSARIITLPVRKSASMTHWSPQAEERLPSMPSEAASPLGRWRAATALAASLMLGIIIGVSDLAPASMLGLAPVVEAHMGDADVVLSALQGSGLTALDEDEI